MNHHRPQFLSFPLSVVTMGFLSAVLGFAPQAAFSYDLPAIDLLAQDVPAPPKAENPPCCPAGVCPVEVKATPARAAEAAPNAASTTPLQDAVARLAELAKQLDDAKTAKAALDKATAELAAAAKAFDDQAVIVTKLAKDQPLPPPTTHKVEIVEVAGKLCRYCDDMNPILAKLNDSGVPIRRVNVDEDSTAPAEWKTLKTPWFLILMDGKEVQRSTGPGAMTEEALRAWHKRIVDWSKTTK